MKILALTTVLLLTLAACTDGGDDDAGEVSFGNIEDGETVTSPVALEFETDDFEIVPADAGNSPGTGHMHVMIDVGCVETGELIVNDDSHRHFGDGSTSTELELEPGEHTLCLQAGDANHTALDVTDEITITVE